MKSVALSRSIVTLLSPPARGAWIEIFVRREINICSIVAPRTGGVD